MKVRMNVGVDDALWKAVRVRAREEHRWPTELVEEALRAYLAKASVAMGDERSQKDGGQGGQDA